MQAVPFSPSLPDVTKKQPKRAFAADGVMLFLSEDVLPLMGAGWIIYKYVMVVVSKPESKPVLYVTLENSDFANNMSRAIPKLLPVSHPRPPVAVRLGMPAWPFLLPNQAMRPRANSAPQHWRKGVRTDYG